jgi:mRNA-degrading endonuclease RelE of RelBE toxin-antitoxin system
MKFKRILRFDRCLRQLKKRFPKITNDLAEAFTLLENHPEVGSVIPDDFGIRKLRIASTDMQRGKSGGFRLLYKLIVDKDEDIVVILLYLYAKSDQSDVSQPFLEILDDEQAEQF